MVMTVPMLLFCSECFYHILLVLHCNFLVISFVGVGKYCLSIIVSLFLASRLFGCLFSFRVAGHTGVLQSSGSVAKYSTVVTDALQVPLEAILLFHIDVAVLAPLSRCE